MIEILKYTILSICQFISGLYNIEIEFFKGTPTKIGDLFVAAGVFAILLAFIINFFEGRKGGN